MTKAICGIVADEFVENLFASFPDFRFLKDSIQAARLASADGALEGAPPATEFRALGGIISVTTNEAPGEYEDVVRVRVSFRLPHAHRAAVPPGRFSDSMQKWHLTESERQPSQRGPRDEADADPSGI